MADIAIAFPGLFRYVDLLNMDARDRRWWWRKARVKRLRDYIDGVCIARAGVGESKAVQEYVKRLEDQITLLEPQRETPEQRRDRWHGGMSELKRLQRRR